MFHYSADSNNKSSGGGDIAKFCHSSLTVFSDLMENLPTDLYSRKLLVKTNKCILDIYKSPCSDPFLLIPQPSPPL